jgi:hypothetical protein
MPGVAFVADGLTLSKYIPRVMLAWDWGAPTTLLTAGVYIDLDFAIWITPGKVDAECMPVRVLTGFGMEAI